MIVESHDKLREPRIFTATRLLVCFEDGTPAVLIVHENSRHIRVFRPDDPGFNDQLRFYNIDKTVICHKHDFTVGSPNILRDE